MLNIKDLSEKLTYDTYDPETPISAEFYSYDANVSVFGALKAVKSLSTGFDTFHFTEEGFKSLCKFIGGQKRFLISLRPENRERVINEKLNEKTDKMVILRCIKQDDNYYIRSIISRNWAQFDNIDVVKTIEPMLDEYGMKLESVNFDNYKMDLRVAFEGDIGPEEDRMSIGISVVNDECTAKPLAVDLVLFRHICSSGIIIRKKMKSIASVPHNTITSDKFAARLSMILTVLQPNLQYFANILNSMKNHKIETDMYDTINNKWQKYYRIPKKMLQTTMESSPVSYYDLINGIAEAARDTESLNARRRGEIAVGNIIADTMSASDLGKLNNMFAKKSQS